MPFHVAFKMLSSLIANFTIPLMNKLFIYHKSLTVSTRKISFFEDGIIIIAPPNGIFFILIMAIYYGQTELAVLFVYGISIKFL